MSSVLSDEAEEELAQAASFYRAQASMAVAALVANGLVTVTDNKVFYSLTQDS